MNAEQRRVASFGAQPSGIGYFSVLLCYYKLMCNKHISFAKPCRNEKLPNRRFQNECKQALKGAEKSYPFGEDVAVYKVKNKMFALMGSIGINLKCDPDEAIIYRQMFDGITPAYHMNKEHWNSVALDSDVPEDLIHKMIDDSYHLIVAKLPKKDRERLLGGFT